MTHAALRPESSHLIDPDAPVASSGRRFAFTEGPIWHPRDQYLLFSDMPADVRRRWDARAAARGHAASNKCNGMTYDANSGSSSASTRLEPDPRAADGRREVLASHFEGKELNSPNESACTPTARSISPTPGTGACRSTVSSGRASKAFRASTACRRAAASRSSGRSQPVRPAERALFLARRETPLCQRHGACLIRVFDVNADGTLGPDRIFASGIRSELEPGVPDGMKCDERRQHLGHRGPAASGYTRKNGALLGKVRVPELVANLHWGKSDWRTLFMTATHSLYRRAHQDRPACRAVHARERRRFRRSAGCVCFGARRTPSAPAPARHDARSVALRADHPGHAERRDDGRRRIRLFRIAAACARAECGREYPPAGGRRPRRGVMIIHVWFVVEPGAPGFTLNAPLFEGLPTPRRWCAAPGAPLQSRASSRSPATSSSKKSA